MRYKDGAVAPGTEMIRDWFRRRMDRYRKLIYREAEHMKGFMALLMKQRNTDQSWTREEIAALKRHVRRLCGYLPALFLFLLPFGILLLPVLAEVLDRRRERRRI